jgi:hypothetical protein
LALLVGVVLLVAGVTRAADAPAGVWRLNILGSDRQQTPWLLQFANADGKWTGSVVAIGERMPKVKVEGLTVDAERLRFTLKGQDQTFTVDAKIAKTSAKVMKGSFTIDGELAPCELESTTLTSLKSIDLAKDLVANQPDSPKVFTAILELLASAESQKSKPEEVRGWAEKLWKSAEPYGVRWQQEMALATAEILGQQAAYTAVGLAYAQRAERLLEPKDSAQIKQRVLKSLASALEKAGKADEAKEVQGRIAKLDKEAKAEVAKSEAQADEEYLKNMPPFKIEPFTGRKGKSTRTVMVELFTGANCPPCVGADLAFDGLLKTYKPGDVVLVQYHVHIPTADPLANLDTDARLEYYNETAAPTLYVNGQLAHGKGGGIDDSKEVYQTFRGLIEPALEKEAQAVLELTAARRGNKLEINAEAAEVAVTGDNVRLRFALVEDTQKYVGANSIRFHHRIVRALPGGENGFPIREKKVRQSVSVDLAELKKQLAQYLNTYAKRARAKFPDPEEVLDLKNLRVVAFIQNDKTKEVLQAKEVEVNGGKE